MSSDDVKLECCNDNQFITICMIVGYSVIIFKLWRFPLLHPFKILTVFLHELGHATAVWLTCGKVTGMEVHPDEGGVTKHRGGIALIVLPAGYLGSAVWGMGLLIASATTLGAEIASGILLFFLIVFIFYAHNSYLRALNLGFIVLLGGLLAVNIVFDVNILRFLTLFLGTMSCLFSIYDIWDDIISRRVNESDASKFAAITHTSSRCWGVIWGLFAVVTLVAAVYFNLLIQQNSSRVRLDNLTLGGKLAFSFACIVVGLSLIHTLVFRKAMLRGCHRRGGGGGGGGDFYTGHS